MRIRLPRTELGQDGRGVIQEPFLPDEDVRTD